jgi:protein-tyrosine phosphatase
MHRNRSTSKRSSSPSVVPEDSSPLPQTDGSCFGKPKAPAAVEDDVPEEANPPELPAFLKLTDAGKYFFSLYSTCIANNI